MAEISLRAYVEYIEDRLARDALSEVVAQCRHVLESYPKFIDAYRLLARALMEQEKNQDALDLFQRVLSADPNDFVAHIGISEVYHEIGSLDQAIWHLERAYEQVPSNLDLQEAIKDLYAERDGQAPRKIHLTGGALARMYASGKLYNQAILELRKTLSRDPERLDLLVLLANTLWDYHQYVDAGKLAGQLIGRLPNSIDANALLARMWLRFGNAQEAEPFLDNVKQLDPYLGYEIEFGDSAPSDSFKLLMLDYTMDRHASEIGAADWVAEIGAIAKERGVTGPLAEADAPPAVPQPSITDIFGTDKQEAAPPPAEPQAAPDWLSEALTSGVGLDQDAPVEPAAAPPPPPEPAPSTGEPDWLSEALGTVGSAASPPIDETSPAGAPSTESPAWLDEALGVTPAAPIPQPPASEGDDTPEWMKDVFGDSAAPPAPVAPAASDDDMPDWMQEAGIAPPAAPSAPASPASSDTETPDWLAEAMGQATQPPPLEPQASEGSAPDWLAETMGQATPPPLEPQASEDSAPDWLAETMDQATPPPFEPQASEDSAPDWLAETMDQATPPPFEPQASEDSAPDWLAETMGQATPPPLEPQASEDSAPDWLAETLSAAEAPAQESVQEPAPIGSETPDWLAETLEMDEPVSEGTSEEASDDFASLDWLSSSFGSEEKSIDQVSPANAVTNLLDSTPLPDLHPAPESSREAPDWLDDILSGEPEEAAPAGKKTTNLDQLDIVSDDWLDDFLASEAPDTPAQADDDLFADLMGNMSDAQPEPGSVAEPVVEPALELPAGILETWDQASTRIASGGSLITGGAMPAAAPVESDEESSSGMLDWLAAGNIIASREEPSSDEDEGGLPDWLAAASAPGTEDSPASTDEADDDNALPDWLTAGAAFTEKDTSDDDDDDDSLPDWLQGSAS